MIMSLLERVFFFHKEVASGNYPNTRDLARHFEISVPTARRDIYYLRDRLLAPLSFDQLKNGYFYLDEGFQLPFEESPRIIFLLAMLSKLAEEAGIGNLKEVEQLQQRLTKMINGDYDQIIQALHMEWIEVEDLDLKIFECIIEAIIKKRLLQLCYRSATGSKTDRRVAPLKIINYQGRWYLFGYCRLRQENRIFHMGRIVSAGLTHRPIDRKLLDNRPQLGKAFGIFQGKPRYMAEILFTGVAAELIRHQHWHKKQQIRSVPEGLLMNLPVSDDREITMKILQYGGMAKVLAPPELKKRIRKEIATMARLYDTCGKQKK